MWWANPGARRRSQVLSVFFILSSFAVPSLIAPSWAAMSGKPPAVAAATTNSPAAGATPAPPALPGLPWLEPLPSKGPFLLLNLASTSLYYVNDGKVVKRYRVGVGRTFEQTPVGNFKIVSKQVNPTWFPVGRKPVPPGPANPLGTRWMGLGGTHYGIHGTNAPWTVGRPSSGGCIRLPNTDAEELFAKIAVGTPVRIIYDQIEVVSDPTTGEDTLVIWADIYNKGVEAADSVLEKLARCGRQGSVDPADLEGLLQQSAKVTVQLTLGRPAFFDGKPLPGGYTMVGGRPCVLLRPLAQEFGCEVGYDGDSGRVTVAGRLAPGKPGMDGRWRTDVADLPRILQTALAWRTDEDGRLDLTTPSVYYRDEPVAARIVPAGGDCMIPMREANDHLGLRGRWDPLRNVAVASGEDLPGAIHNYEPYVLLGPVARKLGLQIIPDESGLRITLIDSP